MIVRDHGDRDIRDLPATPLHLLECGVRRSLPDLAGRDTKVMHVLHHSTLTHKLIVDRDEFQVGCLRFRYDRGAQPDIRRTNHQTLRAGRGQGIDCRQRFLPVRGADLDQLNVEILRRLIRKFPQHRMA